MLRLPPSILTTLALAAACGCSSSSSPSASTANSDAGSLCASDPSFKTFGPGVSAAGTHGYTFQLIAADPPTPTQSAADGNSWTIKVTDAADSGSLDGLTFTVKCSMKMPGGQLPHGCGFPPITAMGNGLYKVSRIIFNMPGHWDLQFTVQNGTVTDSGVIGTCIDQ